MTFYILKRIFIGLMTAFGLVFLVFLLMKLVPGDVISQLIDQSAGHNKSRIDELRTEFGLDLPWYKQFFKWLFNVLQGNLGISWRSRVPIQEILFSRLAVTLELAIISTLISSLFIGIPCGIIAAFYSGKWQDIFLRIMSLASLSVPVFWLGSMFILIFSETFNWSPPLNWISPFENVTENLKIMALPSLCLGLAGAAPLVRMTRNSILEIMKLNYIRTSRSLGISERNLLINHALPNASIPILTSAGLQFGFLLGGVVVIEEVFSLPGIGRLLIQSISQRDYPVVQVSVLSIGLLLITANIIVDVIYAYLDPRIKYGEN